MKNIIRIIILLILSINVSDAYSADVTYKITRLNTPSINIGGKQFKVGDNFPGTQNIKNIQWESDKQSMEVRDIVSGKLYKLSKKVTDAKDGASSIADFFLRTSEGSTRDNLHAPEIRKSPNSANFPEKRLALVIGNSNYNNLGYLRNAQKDASDVADALLALGFDVMEVYETSYQDMKTALNKFASQADNYDVALFYYAGHGTQYEGKNYLLPINFVGEMKSELETRTLHADDVVDRMENSGAAAQILFIDACRSAPLAFTRASTTGLARMEGGPETVIMFSTRSGKTAEDGEGDNSPFAASFINNLSKPVSFSETMTGIMRETDELTNHNQTPLQVGNLVMDFRFNPEGMELSKIQVPKSSSPSPSSSSTDNNTKVDNKPSKPLTPAEKFERDHPKNNNGNNSGNTPAGNSQTNDVRYSLNSNNPNVAVRMSKIENSGDNLVIELILTNKTNKMLKPYVSETTSDGIGTVDKTMAVAKDGSYYGNLKMQVLVSSKNAFYGFNLPPNVPIKMTVRIEDMTKEDFYYLCLCLHDYNPDSRFNQGIITIQAPTSSAQSRGTANGFNVSSDINGIEAAVGNIYRSGDEVNVELILTNKTGKPANISTVYGTTRNMAASNSGDSFDWTKIRVQLNNFENASNGVRIVPNVPIKWIVKIEGMDSPADLAYLNIYFNLRNQGDGNLSVTKK